MAVCQQNLHYIEELQKQAYNKRDKLCSYALDDHIWLSSKNLKAKRHYKLKAKFLTLFWVLHLVDKQAYKFKLPKK